MAFSQRPKPKGIMNEALKTVSSGYRIAYIGFLLEVLAIVLAIMLVVDATFGKGGGLLASVEAAYVTQGVLLLGQIVGLAGRFQCMAAPPQIGGKLMIVFSIVTATLCVTLKVIVAISLFAVELLPLDVLLLLDPVANLLFMVSVFFLVAFTKPVAKYIRREALVASAQTVLMLALVLTVLSIAFIAIQRMAPAIVGNAGNLDRARVMAGILLLVIAVIFIITAICYGNLLSGMAKETLQYASMGGESHEDDRPGSQSDKADADDDWNL
jgi:hypothetical protein